MRAFVVDPGGTTGYGWMNWGNGPVTFHGGELPHDEFLDMVGTVCGPDRADWSALRWWGVTHVICEGFKVGPRTYQTNPTQDELWSVKQHGALEMWARWADIPFFTQMPSAMKFDESGAKIKKLGWWDAAPGVKGEAGHRRAAAKHALKWAVDHRIIDGEALL